MNTITLSTDRVRFLWSMIDNLRRVLLVIYFLEQIVLVLM